MSINIQYFKQFNKDHNYLIIVLSKLNQLNSINLPFEIKKISKNKTLINRLISLKYVQTTIESTELNIFIDVAIILADNQSTSPISLGSNIYDKFENISQKEATIKFSKNLMKNDLFCSNFIFGIFLKSYSFSKYRKNKSKFKIKQINIILDNNSKLRNIKRLNNLLESINFCKDLVSEPANILNPVTYANECKSLKKLGLKIKVLDLNQLEKIGMNSLLSVSLGSSNEPRVIIFEWNMKKNSKPIVLVGKGVTFDTGGISLKPSSGMEEMFFDMAGSAVVSASMMNVALNKLNKPIVGIIGLVENMPDGSSQRPGDIIKSLSGQTIEVLNTDAEGRLVLADLLTYIQKKYNPKAIIDFATLTGAIMVALGTHRAGLFSNNHILSKRLEEAGNESGEKIWRLPLGEEYDQEIDSNRADMKNIGSTRFGGSIQAAQFLQRFINNNIPWAHLDIAGVTWFKKNVKNGFSELHSSGATAFGVRLIDAFLKIK